MAALPDSRPPLDLLSRLPPEVSIEILKYVPGVTSLWSLLRASRSMGRVFDAYACEVVESVIENTVSPSTIRRLMRTVIRVRASHIPTFDDIRMVTTLPSDPLGPDEVKGSELLREFVHLSHVIHMLAHQCIDFYIDSSLSMQPASVVRFPQSFDTIHDRFKNAEYQSFEPGSTGTPSWVEEQRVIKALWRIQLFHDLNRAQESGPRLWPGQRSKTSIKPGILRTFGMKDFEQQQVLTVSEFLEHISDGVGPESLNCLPSVAGWAKHDCAQEPSFHGDVDDTFQQGRRYLDTTPPTYAFYYMMASDYKMSPLVGLPFNAYRKFGFAIWDGKRMTDLGFAEPGKRAILRSSHYYYIWRSILREDELNPRG